MICLSLVALVPLLEFLGFSAGALGILAMIAELTDDYAGDQASTLLEGETKSH